MPSREEIVEWLREAALISDYSAMLHALKPSDKPVKKSIFHQRAAQVESMRCETCVHYDKHHQLCEVVGGSELLIPGYFGCFSHELKEVV